MIPWFGPGEHHSWSPEMFRDTPPSESKHCQLVPEPEPELLRSLAGEGNSGNFSNGSIGGNKTGTTKYNEDWHESDISGGQTNTMTI